MRHPKANKVIIPRPYSPSFDTDISKTFDRARKAIAAEKRSVVSIRKVVKSVRKSP